MSNKSKSDTSSTLNPPYPTRMVKNPLLSASVTGLTFDDFPKAPVLLPAAPPIAITLPKLQLEPITKGVILRGKCVRSRFHLLLSQNKNKCFILFPLYLVIFSYCKKFIQL